MRVLQMVAVVVFAGGLAPLAHGQERVGYAQVAPGAEFPVWGVYNSAGRGIRLIETDAQRGESTLVFEGLGGSDQGHVQVSSQWSATSYCKVKSRFTYFGDVTVTVACFDATGAPQRGYHEYQVAYFGGPAPGTGLAYTVAYDTTARIEYTADARYTFNGSGERVRVLRLGTGSYRVRFEGWQAGQDHPSFGNAQVTAYGTDNSYCTLRSAWPNAAIRAAFEVIVDCFVGSRLADARFGVLAIPPLQGRGPSFWMAYTIGESPHASTAPNSGFSAREWERTAPDELVTDLHVHGRGAGGAVLITRRGGSGWCSVARREAFKRPRRVFPSPSQGFEIQESFIRIDPACTSPDGRETGSYSLLAFARGGPMTVVPMARTATLRILRLRATSRDACNGRMDFFATVKVVGETTVERRMPITEGNDIRPDFAVSAPLAPDATNVRVFITVKDEDDWLCGGGDDVVDVNPSTIVADFEFLADLATWIIWDEHGSGWLGDIQSLASLEGRNGRETGIIDFRLEISPQLF